MNLFITNLLSDNAADRFYFFAVVLTVLISITLHELAHGWAAMRRGDLTPQLQGRMTGNPLVHMGPFSLVALAIAGIAWGQMPVDPTRLRGRYGEAFVAVAGPAMNLLLAILSLTALGLLMRMWGVGWAPPVFPLVGVFEGMDLSLMQQNALRLLAIFGTVNLLLMMFNLLPVPPLDGAHILANFSRPYAQFAYDPKNQGALMLGFIFAFVVASGPMGQWCVGLMDGYVGLITGRSY